MMKQLVTYGLAVMTTLLALVVLWQFRIVVVYLLISLMLAAALRPIAGRLVGRSIVVRAAWLLLYLVVLIGFGFFLFLLVRAAINEVQQLVSTISVQDAWRLPLWVQGSSLQNTLMRQLPPPSKLIEAVTGDQGQLVLPTIIGISQGIGGVVSGAIIILFLSLYWSINQVHFERLWLSLLPAGQRKQARGVWRTVEPDIGAYIHGEVGQSLLALVLLGLGFWLLGSPYPAFLALIGALACLIPVVGIVLAVIPVLLIGLLTSLQVALLTTLYTLVILTAIRIWVKPRLFNRRWDNPILTLVLVIALASAFGLVGIIVAPPLSVVIQIFWRRLITHRHAIGLADQVSDLKLRQEHLMEAINAMDGLPLPLVTSSMKRLTSLIEKAEPVLLAASPAEPSEQSLPIPKATIIEKAPPAPISS